MLPGDLPSLPPERRSGWPALPAPKGCPSGSTGGTQPPQLRNEDGDRCTGTEPWLAFASMNDLSSHFVSPVDQGSIVNTKSIGGLHGEPSPANHKPSCQEQLACAYNQRGDNYLCIEQSFVWMYNWHTQLLFTALNEWLIFVDCHWGFLLLSQWIEVYPETKAAPK